MSLATMYPAKNNSPVTSLAAALNSTSTTMTLDNAGVLPDAPNLAVIGSSDTAEIVLYTAKSGNTLTIVRGQNGTDAGVWSIGAPVSRTFTSLDHDTFRDNILDLESRKANTADLGAMAAAADAASDGKSYGRKDGGWYDLDGRYYTESEIDTLLSGKQATLTFDSSPTQGSNNPVKSGGVYTALADKAPLASPNFTGDPTRNTSLSVSDKSKKLATTEFCWSHSVISIAFTMNAGSPATKTVEKSFITSNMIVVNMFFGTPSAVTSNVTWSTADGSVTVAGTFTDSSTVRVLLALPLT